MSSNTESPKSDWVEITTDQIPEYIQLAWETYKATGVKPVVMLESPPGTGKTHMGKKSTGIIAKAEGLDLAPIGTDPEPGQFGVWVTQAANTPEEALSGLPYPHHEGNAEYRMVRALSGMWPKRGPGIWLFDEPLQAPYTQRFMAQIMYDGRIEEYVLPEDVLVVLMGNSASDRAGVTKMWSHFQNRIITLRVTPTVEGALNNFRVDPVPEVSVYLRWFPESLYRFDAKKFDGPFPTGRTWDFANSLLASGADPIKHYPLVQGLLGTREASAFKACYTAVSELPDIDDMLKNPENHRTWVETTWNNNPHALCALSFVVLRRLQQREVEFAAKAIPIFGMAGMELCASFLAVAKSIDKRADDGKSVLDSPEYAAFMVKYQKLTFN